MVNDNIVNDVENAAAEVRRKAHESLDLIMDQTEGIKENSKETLGIVKEKANLVREQVKDYVGKNQENSVLIATGVGLAVGAVLVALMTRKGQES